MKTEGSVSLYWKQDIDWSEKKVTRLPSVEVPLGGISSPDRKGFVNLRVQKSWNDPFVLWFSAEMLFLLQWKLRSTQINSSASENPQQNERSPEKAFFIHLDKKIWNNVIRSTFFASIYVRFASFPVQKCLSEKCYSSFPLCFSTFSPGRNPLLWENWLSLSFYVERFLTISSYSIQLGRRWGIAIAAIE